MWRSKEYLEWVASQESCIDFGPAGDPHHIKGNGFGGSTKPHDLFTIPMNREHHTQLHNQGFSSFEEAYGVTQAVEVLRTIDRAIRSGIITIKVNRERV